MPSNIDRLKNENPSQRAQDLTESISRISKQDTTETSKLDERKIPKGLREVLTKELMADYKKILMEFKKKLIINETHPKREIINVKDYEELIFDWSAKLINELISKRKESINEEDKQELEALSYYLFQSVIEQLNTISIDKDINESLKNQDLKNKENLKKVRKEIINDLVSRYEGINPDQIITFVDAIIAENQGNPSFSINLLWETINKIIEDYNLNEQKKAIVNISLGYLISKIMQTAAPNSFGGILNEDKFNILVFLQYMALEKGADLTQNTADRKLEDLILFINNEINKKIADSIFYRQFEFIHSQSFGDTFTAIERGKKATQELTKVILSRVIPNITTLSLSIGFLTKINPILGGIYATALPVMAWDAKRKNENMLPMYLESQKQTSQITNLIDSRQNGMETLRTSENLPTIAGDFEAALNKRDELNTKRTKQELWNMFKNRIPTDVSFIIAGVVGWILQEQGSIKGGDVLSSMMLSRFVNGPTQDLVTTYFSQFPKLVADIQKFNEIIGDINTEEVEENETNKIGVEELQNLNISIRNLKYKNILNGIDLDIPQGEFLVIRGTSGGGKSTLIRNMVGLYNPDSGEVQIGDTNLSNIKKYGENSIYSVMSYSNQAPQIFEDLSLKENLTLWSKNEVSDERVIEVLRMLRLDKFTHRLNDKIKNLSGGERVRIGLARTLIKNAKILILDEPTSGLDSTAAQEVRDIILEIHRNNKDITIVCVSHDEDLIGKADRNVGIEEIQSY